MYNTIHEIEIDPSVYQAKPFNIKLLKQDVDKYLKSDDEIIKLEQNYIYFKCC